MVSTMRPRNELYGKTLADEFGPLKLKALREHLVEQGLCRNDTNKRIGRIKRVFKWAVSEELISSQVHEALSTVTGLKFGRTRPMLRVLCDPLTLNRLPRQSEGVSVNIQTHS